MNKEDIDPLVYRLAAERLESEIGSKYCCTAISYVCYFILDYSDLFGEAHISMLQKWFKPKGVNREQRWWGNPHYGEERTARIIALYLMAEIIRSENIK